MALKTDYKDDVLDTSVNTRRKYNMIQNDDGTVSFEDTTEYLQTGDSFGAQEINDLVSNLGFWISGIIASGIDTVTLNDERITENTILFPYVDNTEVTGRITATSTGSVTITLDDSVETDVAVKVKGVNA